MFRCNDCKYNVPFDIEKEDTETIMNSYSDVHEICLKGYCILCTWKRERECKEFEPKELTK